MDLYLAVRGSWDHQERHYSLEAGRRWAAGRYVDPRSALVEGRYLRTAGPLLDREEYIPLEACSSISRYHFEVGWDEAGPWVRDCSRNGTYLNGVRLPALHRHSLRPDDELRASECVVRLTATTVVNPAWLWWNGGTVARLARAIWADRAFDRLPILADALEEAGCSDADLLGHCRQPGRHGPRCCVLDVILSLKTTYALPKDLPRPWRRGARKDFDSPARYK